MSAVFAKFHPNLVVGGTYSGQIVLWDNRSNRRTPVQRTPLSAAAHTVCDEKEAKQLLQPKNHEILIWCPKRKLLIFQICFISFLPLTLYFWSSMQHPVYCVNLVGTQNAHNLISISTDGKMCSWSLDMLSQPQVPTMLSAPSIMWPIPSEVPSRFQHLEITCKESHLLTQPVKRVDFVYKSYWCEFLGFRSSIKGPHNLFLAAHPWVSRNADNTTVSDVNDE